MGAIRCNLHGIQIGSPLGCRHLVQDLQGGSDARPHRQMQSDYMGDGSVVLEIALCIECVTDLDLHESQRLDPVRIDNESFVSLCPRCWRDRSRNMPIARSKETT